MRIAVVHNSVPANATADERDVLVQVEAVSAALRELGHETVALPCTLDVDLLAEQLGRLAWGSAVSEFRRTDFKSVPRSKVRGQRSAISDSENREQAGRQPTLRPSEQAGWQPTLRPSEQAGWQPTLRADLVFNLVESLGGSDRHASLAAELFERLGLPYTGVPAAALAITTDKLQTKQRLREFNLPTPAWYIHPHGVRQQSPGSPSECEAHPGAEPRNNPNPEGVPQFAATQCSNQHQSRFIIKAIWEHASFGMDDGAIVTVTATDPQLGTERLRQLVEQRSAQLRRPCFAEEFIEGREFNLSLLDGPLGPEVLPPAEIDFSAFPAGKPRIVGFDAKWEVDSFAYANTPRQFDFPISDRDLLQRLSDLARQCWKAFGLAGYARVDFRVDERGEPWILEINGNPCLSPDAGFAAAVEQAAIGYTSAIERIVTAALHRAGTVPRRLSENADGKQA